MSNIGTRMKENYETRGRRYLTRRMPVIVRVDGRAFHTFTRKMDKPFSAPFIDNMIRAAQAVADDMQGFKLAYIQSDEVSFLLTDYDTLSTEAWFGYCQNKVESVTASVMTAWFNDSMGHAIKYLGLNATFDARAFNIPREEVANYFLWRALDWQRNSIQMYAGAFFSQKQLHKKGRAAMHEMLHKIGKNWTIDLEPRLRNGTFLLHDGTEMVDVLPKYDEIAWIVDPLVDCDLTADVA